MRGKLEKLEMMRGFAAVYVLAGHVCIGRFFAKNSLPALLLSFGQEVVMLFFLISGFVIYYSASRQKDLTFGNYLNRRLLRIYPIFLLSLVISYWSLGNALGVAPRWDWRQIFGNLLMLQDFQYGKPGVFTGPLWGNPVTWSLSYEWWFYLMFYPIFRFVPERLRTHVAGMVSLAGFLGYVVLPNPASLFMLYFIIWWCGAELAATFLAGRTPTFRSQRTSMLYLGLITLGMIGRGLAGRFHGAAFSLGLSPILEIRHFVAGGLILCAAILWARLRWRFFKPIFGVFGLLAPISYALYVFHYPLAAGARYFSWMHYPMLELVGYLVVTFLAAWLAEKPLQSMLTKLVKNRRRLEKADTGSRTAALADPIPSDSSSAVP